MAQQFHLSIPNLCADQTSLWRLKTIYIYMVSIKQLEWDACAKAIDFQAYVNIEINFCLLISMNISLD